MIVTEIPLRLEPVTRDTFLAPAEPSEARGTQGSQRPAGDRPS